MFDYSEEDFTRTVYTVDEDFVIKERILKDLCLEFAETTSTPFGIGTIRHTCENELRRWCPGGKAALIQEFDTEQEAEQALLVTHRYELDECSYAPLIFYTRNEAQAYVRENQGV